MAGGAAVSAGSAGNYAAVMDPNRKWNNNRRLITLHAWVVLLVITSSTNGFDSTLMNSFQSLPQWEDYFDHPSGGKLGLLNAIQNIGSLAGYPFAPYFSDGIGRRPTIWFGATIMLIGVGVQSAAYNLGMFIGARFCIGFGLTFAANAAPMLVTEISYPTYRAPLTSAYNSLCISTANSLSGFPPSSKGKYEQALKTLAYYHADGDEMDPLVQYEFEEIKAAIELDREVAKNVGWTSPLATPGNRKRTTIIIAIAFFSQWSGNGLISYYLNKVFDAIGITSSTVQLLVQGILAIWNLAWALGVSAFVERIGRRTLFLSSAAGMLVFFTMQTVCSAQFAIHGSPAAAHAVIAAIFLFYAAYDLAFTPLIVTYAIEILPYSLRAKGFNVFNFVISLALIFNQYVNPIALEKIGWRYYIVYCCWIAFEFVFLYFMVIETRNRTLEETAALFDGEDISKHVVHIAEEGGVQELHLNDGKACV
ncbi:hexose transporter [Sparassis crispa]|uniref:Hexose transporter n=1 Tax=Sparassis crispa TaxID=139825 RepID=A0A401H2V1_9APHY|nr:hexose transporter [Sparassis crispa]GBE88765.1 hexose transporter [Sparassis crispa]